MVEPAQPASPNRRDDVVTFKDIAFSR